MRIAYIISEEYAVSPFNGVRIQAQTWADELVRKGHDMVLVNPWEKQQWDQYNIVHIFGPVPFLRAITRSLMTMNKNQTIVYSPIIDTNQSIWKYRLISYLGSDKVRLFTHQFNVRKAIPFISHWFVRSYYEREYVNKAYGVSVDHISIVPLSYRIPTIDYYPPKERFCLHVSSICQPRKNVMRLIDASIKYKFQLKLAGAASEKDFQPFKAKINSNDNIEYLGKISDEELIEQYKKAKVFALPSLYEGVGMVALEAAAYGADIVVTSLGGPKEYYSNKAFIVNPFSVDDIGRAVVTALDSHSFQPDLMNHIIDSYSLSHCVNLLLEGYKRALNSPVIWRNE